MSRDDTKRPLQIALRLIGCGGLCLVAYLSLLLPPGARISELASDKVGHVLVGFTLALSLHALFSGRRLKSVLLMALALSALSEALQQLFGRDAELLDFVADVGGVLAYAGLATIAVRIWR